MNLKATDIICMTVRSLMPWLLSQTPDGGDLYIGVEDDGENNGGYKMSIRMLPVLPHLLRIGRFPPYRYALNLSARMCLTSGFPYRGKHR